MGWRSYSRWEPYKPVAQRRREGEAAVKRLLKKGQVPMPVRITGRGIATTFWGKSWCEHLERFSDYANRLPRGRTYARNGSICDLQITSGEIMALVSGSDLYTVKITIKRLDGSRWRAVCRDCSQSIHSVIDLMRAKLSDGVIQRLTNQATGVFPEPTEIRMSCSCPDSARLCKHLAAVLYGVGHRLDTSPELLFLLRGVDQADLVAESLTNDRVNEALGSGQDSEIDSEDLAGIFGIDLLSSEDAPSKPPAKRQRKTKVKSAMKSGVTSDKTTPPSKQATKKKSAKKSTAGKKAATKKKFSVAAEIAKNFSKSAVVKKVTRRKATRKKTTKRKK